VEAGVQIGILNRDLYEKLWVNFKLKRLIRKPGVEISLK
jgi:hypothetical protein